MFNDCDFLVFVLSPVRQPLYTLTRKHQSSLRATASVRTGDLLGLCTSQTSVFPPSPCASSHTSVSERDCTPLLQRFLQRLYTIKPPNVVVQRLTLLLRIWEVPGSNLYLGDRLCSLRFFVVFLSPLCEFRHSTLNYATTASYLILSHSL
jgi:hypothetical protein